MTDATLAARRTELAPLASEIVAALTVEIHKLGFAEGSVVVPAFETTEMSLKRDPFSGEDSLEAVWKDTRGGRLGALLFHGDGSFYAEFDVIQPHPSEPRWFVEGVTAWGRQSELRAEAKLLPAVGA